MTNIGRIRTVVLGSSRVGKSAVTVRYLTKRYIGEYSSNTDLLYRHDVTFDSVLTEVEILDTCKYSTTCLYDHIRWADAFVIVYSVVDLSSFNEAQYLLDELSKHKLPSYFATLLLGNKRDLDHSRIVAVDAGQELSLRFGCQFYEVSAAENFAGVSLAFHSLLRETRAVQLLRGLPIRRKLGVNSVSKVLGTIFGKNSSKRDRKKRPSLSI
ncbi:ras-related and estrogen-regulated growth inhibitor-like [Rhopalosiphum maidis]|uniref:small monomeric GTPase n=1 Tax=Schizaphis graminum TaxID=13262 RepID=A0A2S2NEQ1_SCHGA|nr:ras-related and estrogen-regulated growth inhibitor-like [Melanaphis sacchari]XP_026814413.1 ras-related and estrogen-regulated growth inhibitor-like [Rhopalosiphum maidis]XP_060838799.1 ras-related and estrogen-regulated growth inhibitor-like [Rhopalosiphum padi]